MTAPIVVRTGGAGEALAQIGQAAAGIIDPDKERREAFEDFLATNPGALERISEQARNDPKALQDQFPFINDDRIAQLQRTPQSPDQLLNSAVRDAFGNLTPDQVNALGTGGVAGLIGERPEAFATLGKRLNEITRITEEEPAVAARVARAQAAGGTEAELAEEDLQARISQAANDAFDALSIPEQQEGALRTRANRFFEDADVQRDFQNRLDLQEMVVEGRSDDVRERAIERMEIAQADRWVGLTNVGTSELWRLFLYDTQSGQRAKDLADGVIQPDGSQLDSDLLEVGQAFRGRGVEDQLRTVSAARAQVTDLVRMITRTDADGNPLEELSVRRGLVDLLNSAIRNLHNLSPEEFDLQEAFIPPGRRNRDLQFRVPTEPQPAPPSREALPRGTGMLNEILRDFEENIGGLTGLTGSETGLQSRAEVARGITELSQEQQGLEQPTPELPPTAMFNEQQIDFSALGPGDVTNIELIQEEARGFSFKELMDAQPASALAILEAFRIKSPQIQTLIDSLQTLIQSRAPEEEINQ